MIKSKLVFPKHYEDGNPCLIAGISEAIDYIGAEEIVDIIIFKEERRAIVLYKKT